tara:strand:- start:780 stop:1301 length:522 start_codon:yes stop_codon:yes gene_type:complete
MNIERMMRKVSIIETCVSENPTGFAQSACLSMIKGIREAKTDEEKAAIWVSLNANYKLIPNRIELTGTSPVFPSAVQAGWDSAVQKTIRPKLIKVLEDTQLGRMYPKRGTKTKNDHGEYSRPHESAEALADNIINLCESHMLDRLVAKVWNGDMKDISYDFPAETSDNTEVEG